MSRTISWISTSALTCASIGLVATLTPATAQVGCGDTLGPGVKLALTADVGPCTSGTDPALTIVGPSTIDMGGHRVRCDDADPPTTGIRLDGKGVKLSAGGVAGCDQGIVVAGAGGHKLDALAVEGSTTHGVRGVWVSSDKNKLTRISSNVQDDGFVVDGSNNKLENVIAFDNDGDAFQLNGNGNKLKRAAGIDSESDGLSSGGDGNSVQGGVFNDNGDCGANVLGNGNSVQKSAASRNQAEGGICVAGNGNKIKQNRVLANEVGIGALAGAHNNTIQKNTALANGDGDLRDDNPGGTCDANRWKKNVFGTSLADGMPSPTCID
jgi:hypothetical protein